MGTKYSTVTITSYNASPPSDDGTQSASNQVKWSYHRTKLGDPLKLAIETINTNLVAALNESAVAKTDSYTVTAAEHKKTIEVTTASAGCDIILLDAATAAAGFQVTVLNAPDSSNALTIKLATNTDLLNTVTNGTVSLPVDSSVTFIVNSGADGYEVKDSHNVAFIKTVGINFGTVSVGAGTTHTLTAQDKSYTIADNSDIDISNLTEDTAPDLTADYLRTYDADAAAYKKVLLGRAGGSVLMTEYTSTGATDIDFLGIPSWATMVHVMLVGVSTSGTDDILLQLGVSSESTGVESTNYSAGASYVRNSSATIYNNYTTGFGMQYTANTQKVSGVITFYLENSSNNTWLATGTVINDGPGMLTIAGAKMLSSTLTRVRLTTLNGTDTFDAGAINVRYQ